MGPSSEDPKFRQFLLTLDAALDRALLGEQTRSFLFSLNASDRWRDPVTKARASVAQRAAWERRRAEGRATPRRIARPRSD